MTDQNQVSAADPIVAPQNELYNLQGVVNSVEHRVSKTKTPYAYIKFATTLKGKPSVMTAMAFGKAFEAVKDAAIEGATVRLNGFFASAPDGGRTFTVVQLGREPAAKAA